MKYTLTEMALTSLLGNYSLPPRFALFINALTIEINKHFVYIHDKFSIWWKHTSIRIRLIPVNYDWDFFLLEFCLFYKFYGFFISTSSFSSFFLFFLIFFFSLIALNSFCRSQVTTILLICLSIYFTFPIFFVSKITVLFSFIFRIVIK